MTACGLWVVAALSSQIKGRPLTFGEALENRAGRRQCPILKCSDEATG
jgi:hypothetical protein